MKTKGYVLTTSLITLTLAACGGGGGGGSGSTTTPATETTFEGSVIDGYISGATVCLDLNDNYLCDDDEPSSLSRDGGFYSFTYTGDISTGTQVLAVVTTDSIDEDRGPVEKPFNLMTPYERPSVVTPLTTMVSEEILASGKKLTATEAEASVKVSLGLEDTDTVLDNDFVENGDAELQETAVVIATALAATNDALEKAVEAEDLTPSEKAKAAVKVVKTQVLETIVANGEATVSAEDVDIKATNLVQGQVKNIVAATKSGDGEVLSLVEEIQSGTLMTLYEGYEILDLNENGQIDLNESGNYREGLSLELIYYPSATEDDLIDIDNSIKLEMMPFDSSPPEWFPVSSTDLRYILQNDEWALSKDISERGVKLKNNCAIFYNDRVNPSQEICFVSKDVSDKTLGELIPGICEEDGSPIPNCNPDTRLPSGSIVYDWTRAIMENGSYGGLYEIWYPDSQWDGYLSGETDQSIDNFIEHKKTYPAFVGGNCNTAFKVKTYNSATGIGEMEWANNDGDCRGTYEFPASGTEIRPFEVVTFGNTKILKAKTSTIYRSNNPNERYDSHIFAKVKNAAGIDGIFNGKFEKGNSRTTIPFSANLDIGIFASRIFIDTVFEQVGIPEFPYDKYLAK